MTDTSSMQELVLAGELEWQKMILGVFLKMLKTFRKFIDQGNAGMNDFVFRLENLESNRCAFSQIRKTTSVIIWKDIC